MLLSAYVIVGNWVFVYLSYRRKKYHSPIPLFGAVFFGLGICAIGLKQYWWLGVAIDYGTFILIYSLPTLFNEYYKTSKHNLVRRFYADKNNNRYELSLYKRGIFIVDLLLVYDSLASNPLPSRMSLEGKWAEKEGVFIFGNYDGSREFEMRQCGDKFIVTESNYPQEKPVPYDNLDGLIFWNCNI